jgi:uncharacterized protein (TIGR03435 family)
MRAGRKTAMVTLLLVAGPGLLGGEAARPRFEVASIRPSPNQGPGASTPAGIKIDPSKVWIRGWTLQQLILRAYGLQPHQLVGPSWMSSERFDVQATFPPGATSNQLPEMLQALLSDRFGLKSHAEKREYKGFALVVDRKGAKLEPGATDESAPASTKVTSPLERAGRDLDRLWSDDFGGCVMREIPAGFRAECKKVSMPLLAQVLASNLRTPVTDLTAMAGNYKISLEFPTQAPAGGAVASDSIPTGHALVSSIKRVGLALERRKMPVSVLVVDTALRKPTDN